MAGAEYLGADGIERFVTEIERGRQTISVATCSYDVAGAEQLGDRRQRSDPALPVAPSMEHTGAELERDVPTQRDHEYMPSSWTRRSSGTSASSGSATRGALDDRRGRLSCRERRRMRRSRRARRPRSATPSMPGISGIHRCSCSELPIAPERMRGCSPGRARRATSRRRRNALGSAELVSRRLASCEGLLAAQRRARSGRLRVRTILRRVCPRAEDA